MGTKLNALAALSSTRPGAHWYDRTTRRDLPRVKRLSVRIAAMVRHGGHVLEIGPGPGFLSIELARRGLETTAVENKGIWIEMARRNARRAGVRVDVCYGDPATLPVASDSVDFVVCRAAFKSFAEPVAMMREMRRVLRRGGTALVSDLRRDVSDEEVQQYVETLDGNPLHQWFMMKMFHRALNNRAYVVDEVREMAEQAGWVSPRVRRCPLGFEAWMRK